MSEKEEGSPPYVTSKEDDQQQRRESVGLGAEDAGAIPKGTIDPVYEAKARVLNRAVSVTPKRREELD